jgi:hypothetical protein
VADIRILVALEDDYRAYREVIAAGIRISYPRAEVATSTLDRLEDEVVRFNPHVVISSLPATAGHEHILGWVNLSLQPIPYARIRIGGHYSERSNISLEELLGFFDEVEQISRQTWPSRSAGTGTPE